MVGSRQSDAALGTLLLVNFMLPSALCHWRSDAALCTDTVLCTCRATNAFSFSNNPTAVITNLFPGNDAAAEIEEMAFSDDGR